MARYRKVETRIWTDERVSQLSPDGRYIWLYCLTATDSNMIGLYPFRRMVGIEDTGLTPDRFDAAFSEVTDSGLATYDPESKLLYIPGFLKVNPPQSRNHAKGMASAILEIPRTILFAQLYEKIEQLATEHTEIWDELLQAVATRIRTPSGSRTEAVRVASGPRPKSGDLTGTEDLTGTGTGTGKDKTGATAPVRRGKKSSEPSPEAVEVMSHLNTVTGRAYRSPSPEIEARLRKGATVDEMKLVVSHRWHLAKADRDPDKAKQYVDMVTPFRPAHWENYRALAVEWDKGRAIAGGGHAPGFRMHPHLMEPR